MMQGEGMTPNFQKKKKQRFKKKIPKNSKKSVSYQKNARPSFGMTPTQDFRDLFAKRRPYNDDLCSDGEVVYVLLA